MQRKIHTTMMKGLKPFVKFYYTGRTEDKGIFKMSVYTHSYVCNISKKLNKLLKLHPTPHPPPPN